MSTITSLIVLYEDNEKKFDNLGIGVLKDAFGCIVKETLNDAFELEMEYPITGNFYNDIKIGRIILAQPNPYSDMQPFRICGISKPIDGIIIVKAFHISYDMNGIIVGPISANSIEATLKGLEENSILPHDFKFYTNVQSLTSFQTTNYYNMRSLLFGSEQSILETYKLEIIFDKFRVDLVSRRGSDRGAEVRYAKNMTDLTHEISYDNLYNGVYPYYHKEASSTSITTTSNEFTKAYIVGKKPLQDGWLSFTEGGNPYHPIDSSPVQIATQGDYYEKVFTWDSSKQRYVERLYDQTVTLIEGVTSPTWVYIDWSGLPNIVVKANQPGYFKMATETEYEHYDVGDIVYKGSIRNTLTNLVLYYSEVIPGSTSTVNEELSESVSHTDLSGEKILWIDTELAHNMQYNRILPLDLTSEFKEDEEVNDENLKKKALKYIEENKIGQYKYNTKVSFIDLNATTEGVEYKNLDTIQLGDTVKIIYEALDVNVELRVISATYNVLTKRYESIELGEKPETISSSSVQTGDSISSLSNDKGYTTQPDVVKIVASTVTADYLKATNATLTNAQIQELQTARIRCTGILEASQFDIDKLVARMLIADNAEIKKTLTAGEIKVSGDVEIKSGEISIQNEAGTKTFHVDRDGNLVANSARIMGRIEATEGKIGGFTITDISIYSNQQSMSSSSENGVYIGPDGISLGTQLKIYPDGSIVSSVPTPSVNPNTVESQMVKRVTVPNEPSEIYDIIQPLDPDDINSDIGYDIPSVFENKVINIASEGEIQLSDETNDILKVKKGDNIIIKRDPDDELKYYLIDNLEYDNAYVYKGLAKTSTLNYLYSEGSLKFGSIYQIEEVDETLQIDGVTYTVQVGDFMLYCKPIPAYNSQTQEWTEPSTPMWAIYNYLEESENPFFGLTPDGTLYANNAIISGDITAKTGHIGLLSIEADGTLTYSTTFSIDPSKEFDPTNAAEVSASSVNIHVSSLNADYLYLGTNIIKDNNNINYTCRSYFDGRYGYWAFPYKRSNDIHDFATYFGYTLEDMVRLISLDVYSDSAFGSRSGTYPSNSKPYKIRVITQNISTMTSLGNNQYKITIQEADAIKFASCQQYKNGAPSTVFSVYWSGDSITITAMSAVSNIDVSLFIIYY